MKRVEASIQRATVDFTYKTYKDMVLQATLNEDSRYNIDMGVSVGITDLIIFLRVGDILHVLFLELKTKAKTSKLRDVQVEWYKETYLKKLQAKNTHYAVAYGFAEAKLAITNFLQTSLGTVR